VGEARREFWERVMVLLTNNLYMNAKEAAAYANSMLEEWDKRWGIEEPATEAKRG